MKHKNNAYSVLNGSISNVATAITVATGTGSRFPTDNFKVTLIGYDVNGNENAWEICLCTSRGGDVLTVVRGQEGTTAVAWANATRIENRLTADTLDATLEPAITAGTTSQYWRGDKSWRDFFADVRAATLTGLSTATNAVIGAADTVLGALGKLQAQITGITSTNGLLKSNGATVSAAVAGTDYISPTTPNFSADITLSGAGRRITGDFSNATPASRASFQTSTTNSPTILQAIPAGTGQASYYQVYNNSDIANAGYAYMGITNAIATINSAKTGSGAALPLAFSIDSSERMRIDTAGNVGIGASPVGASYRLTVVGGRSVLAAASDLFALSVAYNSARASSGETPYIGATDSATPDLVFSSASGSELMRLSNSGVLAMKSGSIQEVRSAMGGNNINLSAGNYFTKTISGATTLTVSNAPVAGTAVSFILELTNGGSAAITWWPGITWVGGVAPALTAAGVDLVGFYTHDGGATWRGMVLAKDIK